MVSFTLKFIKGELQRLSGRKMPQVRCPNCGVTINLENRREIDFDLIVGSLKKGPKTFTQLLRTTRLPRKTLNIRLKDLIDSGIIVKDGGYSLTDSPQTHEFQARRSIKKIHNLKSKAIRFVKENPNGNRDAFLILALFALMMIGITHPLMVRANRVHNINAGYQIADRIFEVRIGITNAVDLYSWQGKITYDPTILKVADVAAGEFLSSEAIVINATGEVYSTTTSYSASSILIFATDTNSMGGDLLIGGSLLGQVQGSYGAGALATITFSIINEKTETTNVNLRGGIILLSSDLSDAEGILKIEF